MTPLKAWPAAKLLPETGSCSSRFPDLEVVLTSPSLDHPSSVHWPFLQHKLGAPAPHSNSISGPEPHPSVPISKQLSVCIWTSNIFHLQSTACAYQASSKTSISVCHSHSQESWDSSLFFLHLPPPIKPIFSAVPEDYPVTSKTLCKPQNLIHIHRFLSIFLTILGKEGPNIPPTFLNAPQKRFEKWKSYLNTVS